MTGGGTPGGPKTRVGSALAPASTLLPITLVAMMWGFNWPVVRIMLQTCGPLTLRAAGLGAAAVLIFAWTWLTGTPLTIPRNRWRDLVIAGVLNIAMFNIFVVFGQLNMPTSRAAIVTFTMPLWAALLARLVLGEAIDARRALALSIGLVGLAALIVPFWPVIAAGGVPKGLLYVLVAAVSWAAGTVFLKARPIPVPSLTLAAWQVLVAAVICALAMAAFETPRLDLAHPPQALAFAYHIVFPQCAAYILWYGLVVRGSAATAAIGTLLVPVFGVAGAMLLLGDRPTLADGAGLALILSAVLLDTLRRRPAR